MISKSDLRQVILDQRIGKVSRRIIQRDIDASLQKIMPSDAVIILSGVRRSGKSTLLRMLREQSREQDFYLNFDDERLVDFSVSDFQTVLEVFLDLFGEQHTFYFDEIQNVPSWERFVRRLHNEGKKVYITGSNATMLSRELGTHLTGRYIEQTIFPFSFKEFLDFLNFAYEKNLRLTTVEKVSLQKVFRRFVKDGGFPEYLVDRDPDRLKYLYESILFRDIIVRYNIPDAKPIKDLVHFCASNIGKEISFHSLRSVTGLKSSTTIKEYFEYLEQSFLFFLVPRFDFSVKKQIYHGKKMYCIDTALARNVGFRFSGDEGRMLENIVFLHLKSLGHTLFFHKGKRECDFLVFAKGKIIQAIQVTQNIQEETTRQREIEGLLEAMNEHSLKEGVILTEEQTEDIFIEKKTILIRPIYAWLLKK